MEENEGGGVGKPISAERSERIGAMMTTRLRMDAGLIAPDSPEAIEYAEQALLIIDERIEVLDSALGHPATSPSDRKRAHVVRAELVKLRTNARRSAGKG